MCKAFPKGNACERIQGGNGEIWEAVGSWCKSDKQKEEQVGESFLDFCSVSGRWIKTRESVRQSQTLQGPESARMDLPLSSTPSLTRHGLWEVWPWLTGSHELDSTAADCRSRMIPAVGGQPDTDSGLPALGPRWIQSWTENQGRTLHLRCAMNPYQVSSMKKKRGEPNWEGTEAWGEL